MNPLNATTLVGIVLVARTFGEDTAVRALTLSQATIKAIPGRQNKDITEIQEQSRQAAVQIVQLGFAIVDPNWTDPDLVVAHPGAQSVADALMAGLGAAA